MIYYVFVWNDGVKKKPLQTSYSGPFKVIKRSEKDFVVAIKG